jgi:hypothetical protein
LLIKKSHLFDDEKSADRKEPREGRNAIGLRHADTVQADATI